MGDSSIEWTEKTWNPVVGCSVISPGCHHCYAATMAKRLRAMAMACEIASIRSLVGQCGQAGAPCFVKQMGATSIFHDGKPYEWADSKGGDMREWPLDIRVRQFPRKAVPV